MAVDCVVSIAAKIGEYTVAPIWHQLGYLIYYDSNLNSLRAQVVKLEKVQVGVKGMVDVAERNREVIPPIVQDWLTRVNGIAEEFKKFLNDEVRVNQRCFGGRSCPDLKSRYQVSRKAKKMTLVVDELLCEGKLDRLSIPARPPTIGSTSGGDLEVYESRKSTFNQIMEALEDDNVNVIGVYGMGGIGKTTLVKDVVKQAKKQKLFDEIVMAILSQTPDTRKIQGEIGAMLGLKFHPEDSELIRAGGLRERLNKVKRILVILDDLWKELDLEAVGIPCANVRTGCKIVLTSRRQDVCNAMNPQRNFPIKELSPLDAWNLFRKMAGETVDRPDLHPTAKEVAKECAGLPLAIVTVARALKSSNNHVWSDALRQLRNPTPKAIEGMAKEVYLSLELSYNFLEGEEVKNIFLLCCLFQEDSNIRIEDLVRYGMGLRMFENTVLTLKQARDRVHTLVDHLKAACLLLESYSEAFVRMHDVVRDFGISVASDSGHLLWVRINAGLEEWSKNDTFDQDTAISLMHNNTDELPDQLDCPKLKLLLLAGKNYSYSLKIPHTFFEGMKGLEVLHMLDMGIPTLPTSLQSLKNLRTLCLENAAIGVDISLVGELKGLEILSFNGSNIEELPKEIFGQLARLRLLDLSNCTKLEVIPPGVISSLSQLEELYMGNSFKHWEVEGEDTGRSNASLAEFKTLSYLTALEMHVPDIKFFPKDAILGNLTKFKISVGREFSDWERDNCSNSKTLKLQLEETDWGLKNVPYELQGEGFSNLKFLIIRKCYGMECLVESMGWMSHSVFPILEKLELSGMDNLKEIFHGHLPAREGIAAPMAMDESEIVLPKLKFLMLNCLPNLSSFCPKTISLAADGNFHAPKQQRPLFDEKVLFPTLEELYISYLYKVKEIWHPSPFLVKNFCRLRVLKIKGCYNVNSIIPCSLQQSLHKLEELTVRKCDSVEEVFEFEELATVALRQIRTLRLSELPRLMSMWWNKGLRGFLSLQNLTSMEICECNGLTYLFSCSALKGLVKLQRLDIQSCEMMKEIVASKRGEEDEATGMIVFPQLCTINLERLPELASFYQGNYTLELPSLETLTIRDCPKIKTFVAASGYPNTKELKASDEGFEKKIDQEGNLVSKQPFFNEKVLLPTLKELSICGLQSLKEIWHNQFPAESFCQLRVLKVKKCDNLLKVVPSNLISRPSNLEKLCVKECDSVKEVLELVLELEGLLAVKDYAGVLLSQLRELKLCNLPKLVEMWWNKDRIGFLGCPNLSSLEVIKCNGLKNIFLPSIVKGFALLEKLYLTDCLTMEEVIAKEEHGEDSGDKVEFGHIHTLVLTNLPNLRSFYLGNLTLEWPSLEKVELTDCPKMHTFSSRPLITPKLNAIKVDGEQLWKGDLNITIQHLFEVKISMPPPGGGGDQAQRRPDTQSAATDPTPVTATDPILAALTDPTSIGLVGSDSRGSNPSQASTPDSCSTRCGRGVTKNISLAKYLLQSGGVPPRIEISPGQHRPTDKQQCLWYKTEIDALTRQHVPLKWSCWTDVPKEAQEHFYRRILGRLHIVDLDVDNSHPRRVTSSYIADRFRDYKHRIAMYIRSLGGSDDPRASSRPYTGIDADTWVVCVLPIFKDPKYQEKASKNLDNRKKVKTNHCGGSKGFAEHLEDLEKILLIRDETTPEGVPQKAALDISLEVLQPKPHYTHGLDSTSSSSSTQSRASVADVEATIRRAEEAHTFQLNKLVRQADEAVAEAAECRRVVQVEAEARRALEARITCLEDMLESFMLSRQPGSVPLLP